MFIPDNRCAWFAAGLLSLVSSAHAAVSFEKQILPVLNKKCVDCHKAAYVENGKKKEPKADLRLDAAWAILKGSENGPILTRGDSGKSLLYEVLTLPKDDDGFMPPKGDPLTEEETKLVKAWIDEGADFGGWEGNQEGRPEGAPGGAKVTKAREHEIFYKELESGLKPASEEIVAKAKAAGAQVSPLKVDGALLRVDFLTGVSACTDEKFTALLALKEHIAHLDLGRTKITDAALATVAQLPRLAQLDLRQTAVSDAGLESLTALKKLRTLNLYGTAITDAGLAHLGRIKSLKNIYLFQTKATEAGAKKLAAALPGAEVVLK